MEPDQQIVFGPFCFDRATQRLWQGQQEIGLRARTLAVLQYLLEHPGRVIARQEFAQHVWAGTHVTRSVLRVCIWELRQALGDSGVYAPIYRDRGPARVSLLCHNAAHRSSHEPGSAIRGPPG